MGLANLATDLVPLGVFERHAHRHGRVAYPLETVEDVAIAVHVGLHDFPVVRAGVARRARISQRDASLELVRIDVERRSPDAVGTELDRRDAAVEGRPKILNVYAHMQGGLIHEKRTRAEVNSLCIVEFEGGAIGVAENSWAKHGGMDDRVEVYGDGGVVYADLFLGNSALTYSDKGYGYAMEKAGSTKGWTFTIFEEAFNQGYPQELKHFIECVREEKQPLVTGDDGRAVLEVMNAAYQSARTGQKVHLPFQPKVKRPIDLWLG